MVAATSNNSLETPIKVHKHTHTHKYTLTYTHMTPLIGVRANKISAQALKKVANWRLMSENATFRLESKAQQQQEQQQRAPVYDKTGIRK